MRDTLDLRPVAGPSSSPCLDGVIAAVLQTARADGAFVYELLQLEDRVLFGGVRAAGRTEFIRPTQALGGSSVTDYWSCAGRAGEPMRAEQALPIGRFARLRAAQIRPLNAWERHWRPAGIGAAIGMTVADTSSILGGIVAVRLGSEARFSRRDHARLKGLQASVGDTFSRLVTQRREVAAPSGTVLAFGRGGALLSAAPGPDSTAVANEVVRRLGRRAADMIVDGALRSIEFGEHSQFHLTRLAGDPPMVIATAQPGAPVPLTARHLLTPAQHQVAELAVIGATIDEIARHLRRSPDTVNCHLKGIYERLGIGSRVELAVRWSTTAGSGTA